MILRHGGPFFNLSTLGLTRTFFQLLWEKTNDYLSILLIGVTLVRLCVWDTVVEGRSRTVKEALTAPSSSTCVVLAATVRKRARR